MVDTDWVPNLLDATFGVCATWKTHMVIKWFVFNYSFFVTNIFFIIFYNRLNNQNGLIVKRYILGYCQIYSGNRPVLYIWVSTVKNGPIILCRHRILRRTQRRHYLSEKQMNQYRVDKNCCFWQKSSCKISRSSYDRRTPIGIHDNRGEYLINHSRWF